MNERWCFYRLVLSDLWIEFRLGDGPRVWPYGVEGLRLGEVRMMLFARPGTTLDLERRCETIVSLQLTFCVWIGIKMPVLLF